MIDMSSLLQRTNLMGEKNAEAFENKTSLASPRVKTKKKVSKL